MPGLSERAYIGAIRCECGGQMDVDESRSRATTDGVCYTVECPDCGGTGGYNSDTLEVYGATEALELVGE